MKNNNNYGDFIRNGNKINKKTGESNMNTNDKNYSQIKNTVNCNLVYQSLKEAINERHRLDLIQKDLWKEVRRGYDKNSDFEDVTFKIGEQTNKINKIISQLLKYKYEKPAYDLAIEFLNKEKDRTERIITKWRQTISDVESGRAHLIDARGAKNCDTKNSKAYLKKKEYKYALLEKQIQNLRRYL